MVLKEWALEPAALTSSENLLEMSVLKLNPQTIELQSLESSNLCYNKLPT